MHTEHGRRRTLQRSDVASVVAEVGFFDFLLDIVPKPERK
jgi:hypothetical protein